MRRWKAVATIATAAFVLMTLLVAAGATRAADLAIIVALQAAFAPSLDLAANYNTVIGQATVTLAITAALALYARWREPGLAWAAPLFIAVPIVMGVALKVLVPHPSPPEELTREFWNPLGVRVETPGAYPSGHVTRVAFLCIVAAVLFRQPIVTALLAATAAFTVVARVYIGDHWPSDALGGLALGIASGAAAAMWLWRARVAALRSRP